MRAECKVWKHFKFHFTSGTRATELCSNCEVAITQRGRKTKLFKTENVQANKQINFLLVRNPFHRPTAQPADHDALQSLRDTKVQITRLRLSACLPAVWSIFVFVSQQLAGARWYEILIPARVVAESDIIVTSSSSCEGTEWKVFAHWRDKKGETSGAVMGETRDASPSNMNTTSNYQRTTWRFYFF